MLSGSTMRVSGFGKYQQPVLSRILVVFYSHSSKAVTSHERDQVDSHPTLGIISHCYSLQILEKLLSKGLQESKIQNHIQLLDHDRWQGNLSEQRIGSIFSFWDPVLLGMDD